MLKSQNIKNASSMMLGNGAMELNKNFDQEYVNLKFYDWRTKMLCATCKTNENEVIL